MGDVDAQPPWDAQKLVAAQKIPVLPWCPELEGGGAWWRWGSILVSWLVAILYLEASGAEWWLALLTLFFLWPLYGELRGHCDRLTVTAEGFEIRGVLRKRSFPWAAIERLQVRRYEIQADLGRYGREAWRFDGQRGRPSASEVAGVLERLRLTNRGTAPHRRSTPSWGAAVVLAGSTASLSAAVAGFIGSR